MWPRFGRIASSVLAGAWLVYAALLAKSQQCSFAVFLSLLAGVVLGVAWSSRRSG